jgi:hypothetical protein
VCVIANFVIATFQADKLQTLIKAAKIEDVEPIWTSIFAKVRTDIPSDIRAISRTSIF